jgi:ribosomal-protein-serine acetyltransferase
VPYRLETGRLLLRCWEPDDASEILNATLGQREWLTYAPWVGRLQSIEEAAAFTRASRGLFDLMRDFAFGAWEKGSAPRLLGGVQLHSADAHLGRVTIDYWLRKDAIGHGFAREAVAAVVDLAFGAVGASRVEILVAVNNTRSRALPVALGFHKEGVMRHALVVDDKAVDMVVYGLLASDRVTRPPAA